MTAVRRVLSAGALVLPLVVLGALGARDARAGSLYDWTQFNGDPQHSGNNTLETSISASNVASLTQLFQVTLPAIADGAPVLLTRVSTPSGVHDLLFVTTTAGHALAIDAHSGSVVWQTQFGPGTCTINGGAAACTTTSSPAVDPGRAYVYVYGLDGYVHRLAVGTGAESTGGGWPQLATMKVRDENGASSLSIATSRAGAAYLYAAQSGYDGDGGDYQGHITAINLTTGAQTVFNSECSNQTVHFVETPGSPDCAQPRSGIWARSGVVYDAVHDQILAATGNGAFAPSTFDWGDTLLALTPAGVASSGSPLDSYTPTTYSTLQNNDEDLGSTGPAILPTPSTSRYPHLVLQSGKDAELRLLNLDNLSNQGAGPAPGRTGGELALVGVPQGGRIVTAIATWTNPSDGSTWAYLANGGGVAGVKLTVDASGNPGLSTAWQNGSDGTGASPLVANGVLYYAGSGGLLALSAVTGARLWQAGIGAIHWQSPVVANGTLYIEDQSSHLTAFALPGSSVPVPALPNHAIWLEVAALLAMGFAAMRVRRAREAR
jgi:hypothetical protein